MGSEKVTHHLSVFLIKDAYKNTNSIIKLEDCDPPIRIPISGYQDGLLYLKKTPERPPKWASLFFPNLDIEEVLIPGLAASLLFLVGVDYFVIAFGQGGRFLLRDEVWEERFGLICTLNSVDPKSLRCVDVQSLDALDSQTRIQSAEATSADKFGLNIEQDMLKAVVGTPTNQGFGSRMTGSDSLSVSVKMNISDLPELLKEYKSKFEADLRQDDYQWINNISLVKNKEIIRELENDLNIRLAKRDFKDMWLSIPEIIEWDRVDGFIFTRGRKERHHDINFHGFLKTIKSDVVLNLEILQNSKIQCVDAEFRATYKSWSVLKCLYAEAEISSGKFILNSGKWYSVATDFVDRTNSAFLKITRSKLTLPEYNGGGEGKYNKTVVEGNPEHYMLFDADPIFHGGGQGQIEVCDLLSSNKELIHVKIYGKSAVFSHLFSQGFVSGQLIQIDAEFRKKIKARLKPAFVEIIDVEKKPNQDEFTVIFAIISEYPGQNLHLPFFSRVNVNYVAKVLTGFGYKVELLKIGMTQEFAKTTNFPEKGKGKKKIQKQ